MSFDFTKYEVKEKRPRTSDFIKRFYYKNGKRLDTHELGCVVEEVKDLEGYNQASNQYYKRTAELENQKRNDLIEYLELENYPKDKVEKLFKYVDTYVMESLSEFDNEYYLEVLNDFADLIRK